MADGAVNTADTNGDDSSLMTLHFLAKGLGYMVGFGSLMLYTPIAIRVCRQKHADGLVILTWWLKVFSYLLSAIYYVRKGYDLSTYAETIVIAIESIVVLALVAWYQNKTRELSFWIYLGALAVVTIYGFTIAPDALVATGQLGSVVVNSAALVPQFHHNFTTKTKGDYSPLTAGLAVGGCLVRIFTTVTLNGSDPVLITTFFFAVLVNLALLLQILYYGMVVEGLTVLQVFLSDVVTTPNRHRDVVAATNHRHHCEDGGVYEAGGGDDEDPLSILQKREPIHHPGMTNQGRTTRHDRSERPAVMLRPTIEFFYARSTRATIGDLESDNNNLGSGGRGSINPGHGSGDRL